MSVTAGDTANSPLGGVASRPVRVYVPVSTVAVNALEAVGRARSNAMPNVLVSVGVRLIGPADCGESVLVRTVAAYPTPSSSHSPNMLPLGSVPRKSMRE